jgi:predicted ATPase
MCPTVAASRGVSEAGVTTETIQDHLSRRQVLVVLDNGEHLLTGTASLADSLLGGCGGLRILATSREALHIPGETVWPVPAPRAEEAQDLFVMRARAPG